MLKAILDFFRRKKRKRSNVSIEFPRGRRILFPGIQPIDHEEEFFTKMRFDPSKNMSEDLSTIYLGREIDYEGREPRERAERIPDKFVDRIPQEEGNEFDPEEAP